jgi:lipopolysaccharide/colanic/teichoic acid biosynthesis glycosyltransferase
MTSTLQPTSRSNQQFPQTATDPLTSSPTSQPTLIWRQSQLIVKPSGSEAATLVGLQNPESLVECLHRSAVELVRLDPILDQAELELWANACDQAGKPVYLHLPAAIVLPRTRTPLSWQFKRVCDWIAAALLLLILFPVLLVIGLLVRLTSPGPILFRQWRVGARGRLFQIYKFRSMHVGSEQLHQTLMANQQDKYKLQNDQRVTPLGRWLRKYRLDELPQLLNVLQGEMSLVGPRPWALYNAARISPEQRSRLNALPGITGAWQVQARSTLPDLSAVNQCDLHYLQAWSLGEDLRFLLLTIPKVLSGSEAS